MKKDINYLYTKHTTGPSAIALLALAELNTTLVSTDTAALEGLCIDNATIYWPSLVGNPLYPDKCKDKTLYAFADYSRNISDRVIYTATTGVKFPVQNTANLWIFNATRVGYVFITNQYLKYILPVSNTIGKRVRITHSLNPSALWAGTIAWFRGYPPGNATVFDLPIYYNGANWASDNYIATLQTDGTPPLPPNPGIRTYIEFIMPSWFDGNFYIGNNITGNSPFGNIRAIKKLEIFYP